MENVVVMFPSLGMGHLISMVELGKLILTHNPSLTIAILLTPKHHEATSTANYIKTVTGINPSITFHHLRPLDHPPEYSSNIHFFDLVFRLIKDYKPVFRETLQEISKKSTIKSVILDFMSNDAFQVSTSLNIPTYYLFTGSAFSAGILLYMRTMLKNLPKSLKDLNIYIQFPGNPPIYSLDMPTTVHDRNSYSYKNVISTSENMGKSSGIIVNTFAGLEPRVMKAIADGEYIPDGPTPPTYYVGPLIKSNSGENGDDKCLNWLSSQPSKSVVVLIFGSIGKLKKDQLMEIANGLEKSGQRFLWVVRNPPPENETGHVFEFKDPDLDDLLPVGFLDRNKEKGLVVKNWAPQGEILRHESVGGFVCHCGWNSVLEAMHAGVPLVAWPLYAEQKMNRVHLVEGIKVALRLKMSENGFVTAEELSERLKELMEEESGRKIRDHVLEMSVCAKSAVVDGGSSRVAVAELVESMESVGA